MTFTCLCRDDVNILFSTFRTSALPTTLTGSMVGGGESSGSLRRVSSMRKTFTSAGGGLKKRSVALQVKFQAVTHLSTVTFRLSNDVFILLCFVLFTGHSNGHVASDKHQCRPLFTSAKQRGSGGLARLATRPQSDGVERRPDA